MALPLQLRLNAWFQIDENAILGRHLITPMKEGVQELQVLVNEWIAAGSVSELDWTRMRALEFQDALRSRDDLAKRQSNRACVLCRDFDHHVGPHFPI